MTWTADLVAISCAAYRHRKARPVLRKVGCRAWTPDLLQGLRVLAALGYSSRDIAYVLGMDRKAVQSNFGECNPLRDASNQMVCGSTGTVLQYRGKVRQGNHAATGMRTEQILHDVLRAAGHTPKIIVV